MIMFDYLTTKGVKTPQKWLYNMEAAPYHIYSRYKILYCRLFLSNIYISNPLCVLYL